MIGDERATYEVAVRKDGPADFHIVEQESQGHTVKARRPVDYSTVYFIETVGVLDDAMLEVGASGLVNPPPMPAPLQTDYLSIGFRPAKGVPDRRDGKR